jgi:hypothetical protein
MKKAMYLMLFAMGMLIAGSSLTLSSCTKEGPQGIAGTNGKDGTNGIDGTNGQDGVDGASTCTECHKVDGIELMATQFELSKHSYGEAAFEEAGNTSCTPCHASEAFKYVCENNIPSTFTLNTTTNKYVNDYATISSAAYGDITCGTCHSSLHTTYSAGDLALTTVLPVSMTMWAGGKTIDCAADGGRSNLCIKCHQPRPFTASAADGNVLDYASIAANPTAVFYDPAGTTNKLKPGYRTHTHYGTAGAVFAGKGGIEFSGSVAYQNSVHTVAASCQDCHMATVSGRAGGHTFNAAGNFNGCNQTDCHADVSSSSSPFWTTPRSDVKTALEALAAALQVNGVEIMNRNPDAETNMWAANTSNKYDGYLNIYDPINNPNGTANNPTGIFQNPSPASSWSQEQKDFNLTLPKITLTNAQMGSIINFQLCLRDYSLGIHNYKYTMALLQNSLAVL